MSSIIVIAAFYRFVRLNNFAELQIPLLKVMRQQQIKGTVLLAAEGVNGTVAGTEAAIAVLFAYLQQDDRLRDFDSKLSYGTELPFYRTRVKLKREIVTMGVDSIDPHKSGNYIEPSDWNRLISDPDVTVIDTRNDYESAIGSFAHAKHAKTKSFRDFPGYVQAHLDPQQHKKIAMFCTGGIRCEKSTAYLREQGFNEVFHLKGGILNYLEKVPEAESLWHGECFVFDNRVSVNHKLEKGCYDQCHACRLPISAADMASDLYQPGISCPACFDHTSENEKKRFQEREKQMRLAQARGEQHLGSDVVVTAKQRKSSKLISKRLQREQNNR